MDVVCYPSPTLKQECSEVDHLDESLLPLIDQMFEAMYREEGVGLAASQVGVLKRVVVIDLDRNNPRPMVLLNPRIIAVSEEMEEVEEGCLSFPGVDILIERPAGVTVETLSLEGNTVTIEADGLFARCLQHEIDHLDGITLIDRATPERRKEALAGMRDNILR